MAEESLERWRRASELFDRVRDLDPAARAAFLARTCGDDVALIRLVEELAAADRETDDLPPGSPLPRARSLMQRLARDVADAETSAAAGSPDARTLPDTTLHASDEIGPYRLLQKIGEGGMGEVWRAEQTRPIRRDVALKVIKAGLDTKRVVARFEMERQVLALMDHPAIAKVYEAGETPRGLPYFAMEYVAGEPVTEYCDRHRLGTQERLDLFARICAGVQHAHEKGVIHRDLKPSNVLVTLQGDRPVPKIIDFGVAKATAQRLTEKTLFTELGVMIGTPSYMSPEQADLTGLDVDTRTDVYALGVMLYELLTGVLPFDAKTLREAGYDEIRRWIREVDPPKPSTRAEKLGESSAEIARRRRTVPSKLVSRLRGDLDWIVMRCLEKDRTRRYASPNELAADLRRHLSHEPVAAGPPGATYRARKFIRRHRVGVFVVSAAVLALAAFAVSTEAQNRRIAAERDRADKEAEVSRRVTDFMTGIFEVSDPSEARGNTITAREILDRGAEKIEKELGSEPEVKARLLLSMGTVYEGLALFARADSMETQAIRLDREVLGPENPETLRAQFLHSGTLDYMGRFAEAQKLLESTWEAQRRILGEEHPETLDTRAKLAVILERQDHNREAGAIYREVLEARRRTLGDEDLKTLQSIQDLGANLMLTGRSAEAEPLLREAAEGFRHKLGDDHPDTLWILHNLAMVLGELGRYQEAEALFHEVIENRTRVLGLEHPSTNASMAMLALLYEKMGRLDESAELLERALEIRRRSQPGSPGLFALMGNLGDVYLEMGRPEDAERLVGEGYRTALASRGPEDSYTGFLAYDLAATAAVRGRPEEAIKWLRECARGRFGGLTVDEMASDESLKSLRGDPEYERLMAAARAGETAEPESTEP